MTTQFPIRFGKYLLLEKISVGGMAEVFRAKSFGVAGFEKSFALKRILPHISEDSEFVAMFIDEAKIAARLHHANICQIVEFGRVGDSYFQAMEYIPGADVRRIRRALRSRRQTIPPEIALYIAEKVCDGLDYAHRKKDVQGVSLGIVHRDVSPQNVLVSFEGGVKLIDFGIAKAANRAAKTQAGQIKGKFSYLAPEQITGQSLDGRVDLFALGVVFWEMLTGRDLFVANSEMEILRMIIRGQVPPPSQINPSLPKSLDGLVMQALATNPDDRYADAGDFLEEIQRLVYKANARIGTAAVQKFMSDNFGDDIRKEQEKVRRFWDMSKELRLPDSPFEEQEQKKAADPVSVVTFSGQRLRPKNDRPQNLEGSEVTIIQGLSQGSDVSVKMNNPVSAQEDMENILELDDADLVMIEEEDQGDDGEYYPNSPYENQFPYNEQNVEADIYPNEPKNEYGGDYLQDNEQNEYRGHYPEVDAERDYRDQYPQDSQQTGYPDQYPQDSSEHPDYPDQYPQDSQQTGYPDQYPQDSSEHPDYLDQYPQDSQQTGYPDQYPQDSQQRGYPDQYPQDSQQTGYPDQYPQDSQQTGYPDQYPQDSSEHPDYPDQYPDEYLTNSHQEDYQAEAVSDSQQQAQNEYIEDSEASSSWKDINPNEFDDEEPTRTMDSMREEEVDETAYNSGPQEEDVKEIDASELEEIQEPQEGEEFCEDDNGPDEDEGATMFDPSMKPLIPVLEENYDSADKPDESAEDDESPDEGATMFDPSMKPLIPVLDGEPDNPESKEGDDWSIQFNPPKDPDSQE